MRLLICFILLILFISSGKSQILFYHDVIHGGISVGGGNTGGATGGSFNFSINIASNSTVHKAFLIIGCDGVPPELEFQMNNDTFIVDSSSITTSSFVSLPIVQNLSSVRVMDVTSFIVPNVFEYSVDFPSQNFEDNQAYRSISLVVLYENFDMPLTTFAIFLNDIDVSPNIFYSLSEINPVIQSLDIGLSFIGNHFCNTTFDGSHIIVNDINIGLVGGSDQNTDHFFCAGTQGHFYYENNTLFGLGDDNPNEFMSNSDALANIQNYLLNGATSISLNFSHQNTASAFSYSNPIVAAFLAYTSLCQPFETSLLTSDTTTCANSPLQLGASGGIAYEWLPQTNLSCYDCPNPVFSGSTTINYTVRIWASDGCSKVLPVRVRVSSCASLDELGNPFEIFAPTLVHGDLGGLYQIRIKNVQQYQYELYTLEGKVVYQKNGFAESTTLDLWDNALMESGLYLYRIWVRDEVGNHEVFEGKVVVVR